LGDMHICQERYVEYILKWFNKENCKSIATHFNVNNKFWNLDQSPLPPKKT
jgi:hypothetical protein